MRSIWLVFGLCVFLISCATIEVSKEDFIEFSRKYEVNTMAYTQSVAFSPDDKYLATGGAD